MILRRSATQGHSLGSTLSKAADEFRPPSWSFIVFSFLSFFYLLLLDGKHVDSNCTKLYSMENGLRVYASSRRPRAAAICSVSFRKTSALICLTL